MSVIQSGGLFYKAGCGCAEAKDADRYLIEETRLESLTVNLNDGGFTKIKVALSVDREKCQRRSMCAVLSM
ncbi:MAG: hypothetical protein ACI9FZ_001040 [Bacteroidia bacterium]|jgi:hypothetical protein